MQRISLLVLAISWLTAPALVQADDAKKVLEKLQGVWTAESLMIDGRQIGVNWEMTFKDDQWTLKVENNKIEGTHKFDPAKNPGQVEVRFGDMANVDYQGIFRLEDDTYKACLAPTCSDRPTEFKSEAGSKHILIVFKREK